MEYLELTLQIYGGAVLILLIPIPFAVVMAIMVKLWK